MASGTNPDLLRRHTHNMSSTSSFNDTHPDAPWREDGEQAPLLRPDDINRTAYSGAHRPYGFVSLTYCLYF
jgi:hypothetical protein